MKKRKLVVAMLAAAFAFTAAPVFDTGAADADGIMGKTGAVGFSFSRPAFSQASDSIDTDSSLYALPLTTRTYYYVDADEKSELLRSHWSAIDYNGKPGDVKNIAKTLSDYSRERSKSFEKNRQGMLKDAKRDRSERRKYGATFYATFETTGDINVRRADSSVVSFQESGSDYMGGVHGMYGISGVNFDVKTGKELRLTDIFTDTNALGEAIKQQLMFDYPKASFMESNGAGMKETVDQLVRDDKLLWTLDPRGVTFYFNPYLIGSYAEGIFTTTLFFSEYPQIYKKDKFTGDIIWRGPQNYCMEMPVFQTVRLSDSPRDERLSVSGIEDITVVYCGETLLDPVPNQEIRPVFVRLQDGRQYLYVDYSNNKKDFRLRVYDLNGEAPVLTGDFPMTRLASLPKNAMNRKWYIMSDPNNFYMTATAEHDFAPGRWLRCRVGKDGTPEIIDVEGAKG